MLNRVSSYCERMISELFDYLVDLYSRFGYDLHRYSGGLCPLDERFGFYLCKMKKVYEAEKACQVAVVRDYVAGMTDVYALKCMKEISLPEELYFDKTMS